MKKILLISITSIMVPLFLIFCNDRGSGFLGVNASDEVQAKFEVVKSEEEWKKILPTDAYYVLRKKGTERAFTGTYHDNKEKGIYVCAACGNELFSSEAKFDSGTGWPSFFTPVSEQKIGTETDSSWGMKRTEVHCARCGGHLGHVFEDGPAPTGLRYCMNSVSLKFLPSKK